MPVLRIVEWLQADAVGGQSKLCGSEVMWDARCLNIVPDFAGTLV